MKTSRGKENLVFVFIVLSCIFLLAFGMIFTQSVFAQQPEVPLGSGIPPVIDNFTPASSVEVGDTFSYTLEISGGAVQTYTLSNEPLGMVVNAGVISWTPTDAQAGSHNDIVITVANDFGTDFETFSLLVNQAPEITSDPPMHFAVVGTEYTHSVTASGFPAPSFSIDVPFPTGMQIGNASGDITWTPSALGDETVTVRATNGINPDDTQTIDISVYSVPVITSFPAPTTTVGVQYLYDVEATGYPIPTFSLLPTPPTGMTINSNSGLISWTPNVGQMGVHTVTVRATNAADFFDQEVVITVGQIPQLDFIPDAQITVGDSFNHTAVATGSSPITYSLETAPSSMIIDSGAGDISWIPEEAYVGKNSITVVASNAYGSTTRTFDIFVQSTVICLANSISYWPSDVISNNQSDDIIWSNNGLCLGSRCPTAASGKVNNALDFDGINDGLDISTPSNLNWAANDSFTIQAWVNTTQACKDADNKVIIGSWNGSSSKEYWWLGCSQNNNEAVFEIKAMGSLETARELSGVTAINDGQWHHIVVTRDEAIDQFKLYVDGIVEATQIVKYTMPIYDNGPLYIGYFGRAHSRDFFFDGLIDEVSIQDYALSSLEIKQYALNADANIAACSEMAVGPQITSTAAVTAVVNNLYAYDVEATGIPGVTYSLVTTPTGMTIEPTTGLISWTPTVAQGEQQHAVQVQASNSGGNATQSFVIDVDEHLIPNITSTPITEAVLGNLYSYEVTAVGEPVPQFSFGNSSPTGMSIDANTGLITWNVPRTFPEGLVSIVVKATNVAGEDTQIFDIDVKKNIIFLPTIVK